MKLSSFNEDENSLEHNDIMQEIIFESDMTKDLNADIKENNK